MKVKMIRKTGGKGSKEKVEERKSLFSFAYNEPIRIARVCLVDNTLIHDHNIVERQVTGSHGKRLVLRVHFRDLCNVCVLLAD
jgi:hypothetical protein